MKLALSAESLVTTPLEHVEVWHGGVFACSKSVLNDCVSIKELQRAVFVCREWGKCRAAVGEGSPVGGIVTVRAVSARVGRQPDV